MIADENGFRKVVMAAAKFLCWHVSHIEAHLSAAGITDLSIYPASAGWRAPRAEIWLELKVIKDGQIKLRPTQKRWHRERAEAGGRSWVAVLDRQSGDILLVPGAIAAGLDSRADSWRLAATVSNIRDTLENWLIKLVEENESARTRSESKPTSHRDGTQESPGSATAALSEGGEDVGSYHWLTSKP